MNWKKIGITLLFLDFGALTAYAMFTEPVTQLLTNHTTSFWGAQVFLDLCIACCFGGVWLWRDAKKLGINPLPYVLAIPFTGSLALLVYAIRRPSEAAAPSRRLAQAAV